MWVRVSVIEGSNKLEQLQVHFVEDSYYQNPTRDHTAYRLLQSFLLLTPKSLHIQVTGSLPRYVSIVDGKF